MHKNFFTIAILLLLTNCFSQSLKMGQEFILSTHGNGHSIRYMGNTNILTIDSVSHFFWNQNTDITKGPRHPHILRARSYYHQTNTWMPSLDSLPMIIQCNGTIAIGKDNHTVPAVTADKQGYIHLIMGDHRERLKYFKSSFPNNITKWGSVIEIGNCASYPSLGCDSLGTLHLFYRGACNCNGNELNGSDVSTSLTYQFKKQNEFWYRDANSPSQGSCKCECHANKPYPYFKIAQIQENGFTGYDQWGNSTYIDPNGIIHVSYCYVYTDRREITSSSILAYIKSKDLGKTWLNAADEQLKLPLYKTSREKSHYFYGPAAIRSNNINHLTIEVVADSKGTPIIAAIHHEPHVRKQAIHHYDGEKWIKTDLPGNGHTDVPCNITILKNDILMVSLITGRNTIEIYTSTDYIHFESVITKTTTDEVTSVKLENHPTNGVWLMWTEKKNEENDFTIKTAKILQVLKSPQH